MFQEMAEEFFAHFEDSKWKQVALWSILQAPRRFGFDAPKEPQWILWWAVEAGVHMNPHFFELPKGVRAQFEYWKSQLPMYP